jgi:hypothetical protein
LAYEPNSCRFEPLLLRQIIGIAAGQEPFRCLRKVHVLPPPSGNVCLRLAHGGSCFQHTILASRSGRLAGADALATHLAVWELFETGLMGVRLRINIRIQRDGRLVPQSLLMGARDQLRKRIESDIGLGLIGMVLAV